MDYNLVSNIEYCAEYVTEISSLLLYSHVSPALIAIALALFVYSKNDGLALAKVLLAISLAFFGWVVLDLLIWFNYDQAGILMAAWALIEIFGLLLFALSFYFCYLYVEKRDITFDRKILFFVALLPPLAILATTFNLEDYDAQECIANENVLYTYYLLSVKVIYSLLTFGYLIYKFFGTDTKKARVEILVLGLGVISFLYSFAIAGYISENTTDYRYEMYGLFGMVFFVGALAYLIVRFSAFNVKLVGAQALVVTLTSLVAAQLFFYTNTADLIINVVTILLVFIFGYFLVKSVKREIESRERIEKLAKELSSANARLRELDKMKSEFVSIASHQLRAPLTAIRGYASMLLDGTYGQLPEKMTEAASRIEESSRYMALSVDDFLNVSRIESGQMKYEKTVFSLNEQAETLSKTLIPAAEKRGLSLTFRSDAKTEMKVNADVGKVRQIMSNMIDNAMKYTPKGGVTVVAHDDPVKKLAYISITDTGIGLSEETIAKLFEKFSRASNANKVNVSGTGLGLFIARQMAVAMAGNITVTSEGEGKGSTFRLELPLVS